jgi:hypothetical protein
MGVYLLAAALRGNTVKDEASAEDARTWVDAT